MNEKFKLIHEDMSIQIYSDEHFDNKQMISRTKAYREDEPFTLNWIKSFESSDNQKCIFYDVGANIGGFSFIASMMHKNVEAFAFEPNYLNFYSALKTCQINNIENVHPINVAINDKNEFNYFLYDNVSNGSKGNFGTKLKKQMLKSEFSNPFKRTIEHKSGILGVSLDSLVYDYGLPKPNYIKIDVDGNEKLVLQGAKKLLQEDCIKGVALEVDNKIYPKKFKDKNSRKMKNYFNLVMSENNFILKEEVLTNDKKTSVTMNFYSKKL
mgnify:FL=1